MEIQTRKTAKESPIAADVRTQCREVTDRELMVLYVLCLVCCISLLNLPLYFVVIFK